MDSHYAGAGLAGTPAATPPGPSRAGAGAGEDSADTACRTAALASSLAYMHCAGQRRAEECAKAARSLTRGQALVAHTEHHPIPLTRAKIYGLLYCMLLEYGLLRAAYGFAALGPRRAIAWRITASTVTA